MPMCHGSSFLRLGVSAAICLVCVNGFVFPTETILRSSVKLAAKKTESYRATEVISSKGTSVEEESPIARATRTLYKPKATEVIGVSEKEVLAIEREIQDSTKARLDLKRVAALLEDDVEAEEKTTSSDWEVSLAAGSVAAAVTLGTTDSWSLATLALVGVYLLANGDPLEEQTPAGAAARVVGRATVHTLQAMQPKVKAVARVAIRGDDQMALLMERIESLEAENANLRLWQKRRTAVDNSLSKYTLAQLKGKARENGLAVGGDKSTLLMRLVEAEVIDV